MSPAKEEDIQVLTVKDEQGKPIRDARFVEILKSARTRIKSASASLKGSSKLNSHYKVLNNIRYCREKRGLVRRSKETQVESPDICWR